MSSAEVERGFSSQLTVEPTMRRTKTMMKEHMLLSHGNQGGGTDSV